MKKVILAVLCVAAGAPTVSIGAEYYYGGSLGLVAPRDNDDAESGIGLSVSTSAGYGVSGFAGVNLTEKNGFEVELLYQTADLDEYKTSYESDKAEGSLTNLGVNALIVYRPSIQNSALAPFLKGGIGLSKITLEQKIRYEGEDITDESSDTVLGVQLRAGFERALSRGTLVMGYRFNNPFDPTLTPENRDTELPRWELDYATHSIELGYRI